MSDAPEFIYARPIGATVDWTGAASGPWALDDPHNTGTEYIRADLSPQWQPIETAPRDGAQILAYGAHQHYPEEYTTKIQWWSDGINGWGATGVSIIPTHWMPLPKPPTE